MTRIRIVEGTSTIITQGDHYIYSEGNIVFNAAGFIDDTAPQHTYGDPIKAPEISIVKKIIDMYWTYGDTRLNDKSRFYVDVNLIVKTENYKEGETINVVIKNDDGEALTDELKELNITGIVNNENTVIFKEVFKNYTLNLLEK